MIICFNVPKKNLKLFIALFYFYVTSLLQAQCSKSNIDIEKVYSSYKKTIFIIGKNKMKSVFS